MTATGTVQSPTNLSGSTPVDSTTGFKTDTYVLAETGGPSGYTAGAWNCGGATMPDATHVTVPLGANITCTITNDDNAPSLTLLKDVNNNHGGTALNTAWTLTATGTLGSPTNLSGTTPVTSGITFKADTYTLAENSGPSGYTASDWVCLGGTQGDATHITVALGQSATCTITNSDVAPTLKLVKDVTNDNGGSAVAGDWTLAATGSGGFSDAGDSTTFHDVTAGIKYALSESGPAGYDAGTWSCVGGTQDGSNITLDLAQNVTCTITNNDQAPHLIVIKHVDNGNTGATTTADAFTMTINGVTATGGNSFAGAEDPGTDKTLTTIGSYNVTESGPSGYTESDSADCKGTIALGETKTCTITNTAIAPQLKLVKTVINDNGGTKVVSDFPLFVDGNGVTSGVFNPETIGAHTATETSAPEYAASVWGTDCATDGTVSLALGDKKTCTITNDDKAPALHLRKTITNDNGGGNAATDWTLTATGTLQSPTNLSGSTPVDSASGFQADTYTLGESGPTGYTAGSWSCTGDVTNTGTSITLGLGQSATCTINNDDTPAHLIVIKHVVNDNGGSATASAFTTTISGVTTAVPTAAGADSPGVDNVLTTVGSYSVDEGTHTGYDKTLSTGCSGTIALGETKTCTITNDDQQAYITVVKTVNNDHGGSAAPDDFKLTLEGDAVSSGVAVPVNPGTYTAAETQLSGYTFNGFGGDCDSNGDTTVALGESKTCTLTNSDQQAYITVVKVVNNDHGGTALPDDFKLTLEGNAASSGVAIPVDPGTYTSAETLLSGYTFNGFSGDCNSNGDTTVALGESKTCTLTNSDISPTLTVNKVLIPSNDSGLFNLQIDNSTAGTGANVGDGGTTGAVDVNAGSHTAGEIAGTNTSLSDYTTVIGGNCAADGSVTLALAANKTCTITNTRKGTLTIVKDAKPNDLTNFSFSGTLGTFTLDDDSGVVGDVDNLSNTATFSGLVAGSDQTVTEGAEPNPFWEFGGISCVNTADGTPYTGITINGQSVTVHIDPGANVTCTFTNNKLGPTRTLGFWQTHTAYTSLIFNSPDMQRFIGVNSAPDDHKGFITNILSAKSSQLFGAYYSSIPKLSDGKTKRGSTDQARMILLQQLVTAKLNCAAFGCPTITQNLITKSDSDYHLGLAGFMLLDANALDIYNNSGDTIIIGNPGNATPKTSQSYADIVFWNTP